MTSWQLTRVIAGSFILLSLALGVPGSPIFHSAYWLWFTVFVGANLLQSGFSKWCPMIMILKKAGLKDALDQPKACCAAEPG